MQAAEAPETEAATPATGLDRKQVMAILAVATRDELQAAWTTLGQGIGIADLRRSETGLVMVRGRIGGGGAPFNLGEATVTRATVQLSSGEIGHAYALSSDRDAVRLAAAFDALWQRRDQQAAIERILLTPVRARIAERDDQRAGETAATRVNFFTMVRGED